VDGECDEHGRERRLTAEQVSVCPTRPDYVLSLGTCSQPIAAYGACNFTVTFAPQEYFGADFAVEPGVQRKSSGYTDGVTLSGVGSGGEPAGGAAFAEHDQLHEYLPGQTAAWWDGCMWATQGAPAEDRHGIVLSDTTNYILGGKLRGDRSGV